MASVEKLVKYPKIFEQIVHLMSIRNFYTNFHFVSIFSYITDFKCSGKEIDLIKEAQLSFYSGHSAFSFYAAWYTSVIIHFFVIL